MKHISEIIKQIFTPKKEEERERRVRLIRCLSPREFPETPEIGGFWDPLEVREAHEMEKIYNHLKGSSEAYWYRHARGVSMIFVTERLGMVKVSFQNGLLFFEFAIYNSGVRYDIHYPQTMEKFPPLLNFLTEINEHTSKLYQKDRNL